MKPISNRYEIKEMIAPLLGGRLYIGKDMSLMRFVFLYEIPIRQGVPIEPYIQKIGKVMQVSTHTQFLHILDVELAEEQVRIVLTYRDGCMLRQYVKRHAPTFQEAVAMIVQFGRVMLDAAEERSMEFSLHAANIWITDDHKINVINSWDRPAERQRLSKELVVLLLQLMNRTADQPAEDERVETAFRPHLNGLPASGREAVIATLVNAWNGRLSLNAFVQNLQHLLQGNKEFAGRPAYQPERVKREPVMNEPVLPQTRTERELPPEQPARAAKPPKPSANEDRGYREGREPREYREYRNARSDHGDREGREDRESKEDHEEPSAGRRLSRLSKRLWQGLGLAALTIAVFIGVFTLLIQSTDSKGKKEAAPSSSATPDRQSPEPSAAAKESPGSTPKPSSKPGGNSGTSPKPSSKPGSKPSPSASPVPGNESSKPTPSPSPSDDIPAPSGGPVSVPSLVGLTREAAEKQALASGLGFEYVIEANEKAAGTVFKQEPAANETATKGERIKFWVSKGPQ